MFCDRSLRGHLASRDCFSRSRSLLKLRPPFARSLAEWVPSNEFGRTTCCDTCLLDTVGCHTSMGVIDVSDLIDRTSRVHRASLVHDARRTPPDGARSRSFESAAVSLTSGSRLKKKKKKKNVPPVWFRFGTRLIKMKRNWLLIFFSIFSDALSGSTTPFYNCEVDVRRYTQKINRSGAFVVRNFFLLN